MPKKKKNLRNKKYANHSGEWLEKRWFVFLAMPFLLSALIMTPLYASVSGNTLVVSYGTVLHASAPTAPPQTLIYGTNLAPIPMGTIPLSERNTGVSAWGDYDLHPTYIVNDNPTDLQVCSLNYNVVHTTGSPSIQFGDGTTPRAAYDKTGKLLYALNDMNNYWLVARPNDRILMRAWIKTGSSAIGDGATIGLDLYGPTQRLWEVCPKESGNDQENFNKPKDWEYEYVPYGSDWTLIELDFIVPSTKFTVNDYGQTINPEYVDGFIPFLGPSWNKCETAKVWFADIELYIYRNGAWL